MFTMVCNMCICYMHRNPPPPQLQRSFSDSYTRKMLNIRDRYHMVNIKRDNIKLGEELDRGEFGSVLRGVYTNNNKGMKVCSTVCHISIPELRTPH